MTYPKLTRKQQRVINWMRKDSKPIARIFVGAFNDYNVEPTALHFDNVNELLDDVLLNEFATYSAGTVKYAVDLKQQHNAVDA